MHTAQFFGEYTYEKLLGTVETALTISVTSGGTGQKRIVKIYPKRLVIDNIEEFLNFVKAQKHVQSDYFIQYLSRAEDKENVYLLYPERIRHRLQKYILSKAAPLCQKEVFCYFIQSLMALHAIHKAGFYHGQLRLDNILLNDDGNVQLYAINKPETWLLNMAKAQLEYCAPEQLEGQQINYQQIDLWCLGIFLYEMLTRKHPFKHQSISKLVEDISNLNIAELDALPQETQSLVQGLLQKIPDRLQIPQIIAHPWVKEQAQNCNVDLSIYFN